MLPQQSSLESFNQISYATHPPMDELTNLDDSQTNDNELLMY